jgi:hypothetical protein
MGGRYATREYKHVCDSVQEPRIVCGAAGTVERLHCNGSCGNALDVTHCVGRAAVAKTIKHNCQLVDVKADMHGAAHEEGPAGKGSATGELGDSGEALERVAALVYMVANDNGTVVRRMASWVTPGLMTSLDYLISK